MTQSQAFHPRTLNPEPTLQKLQCTEYDERYFMTLEPGLVGEAVCKPEKKVMRISVEGTAGTRVWKLGV